MKNRIATMLLVFLVALTVPLAAKHNGHGNGKHAWKQQQKMQKQLLKQEREYQKHLRKMEKRRIKYLRKQEREYLKMLRKYGPGYGHPAYHQGVPHLPHAPAPPPRRRTGVHGRVGGSIEIVW